MWHTYAVSHTCVRDPWFEPHLTVAWATRTLIVRKLKGLEDFISASSFSCTVPLNSCLVAVTVVSPRMDALGWPFANVDPFPGAELDHLNHADHLKDVYLKVAPQYKDRYVPHLARWRRDQVTHDCIRRPTVPLLWDKKKQTIVNNESSDIIRMLNSAFNKLLPPDKAAIDLYPEAHRAEIDEINDWVYTTVNSTSRLSVPEPI